MSLIQPVLLFTCNKIFLFPSELNCRVCVTLVSKESGGKPSDYKYNKHNNSAVKGKVNSNVKKRS